MNSGHHSIVAVLLAGLIFVSVTSRGEAHMSPRMVSDVEFEGVPLRLVVEWLRFESSLGDPEERVNYVIDERGLAQGAFERPVTIRAKGMTLRDFMTEVCIQTGVGYCVDPFALVIGSRERTHFWGPVRIPRGEIAVPSAAVVVIFR